MFDFSDPQKRERLLIVAAGIFLCGIVVMVLPAMWYETNRLNNNRQTLRKDIEELELHAQNKEKIQERLTTFVNQSFSSGSSAQSGYLIWLGDLARSAGLTKLSFQGPTPSSLKGAGTRYTFTVTGTGKLDQISEFLRRFHRTEYLHLIQNVSPRPSTKTPGEFDVTIKIEALALTQVRTAKIPDNDAALTAITDEETQMLTAIKERAILSEYTPPKPPDNPQSAPPPIIFDDHPNFCIVNGIVEADGKPQCWIDCRTEGKKYYLFEEESFKLGDVNCTIKKIEVKANRVQIAAAGGLYAVRLGKSFGQSDEPSYFFTGIVDENGEQWTAESAGEPYCVIVNGADERDRVRNQFRLSAGESFPMQNVRCTVKEIEADNNQIQIEAVGVTYTLRAGSSFSEFEED